MRRQKLRQQTVECLAVTDSEVAQHAMANRDAATDPAIYVVLLAQPRQAARAAEALTGCVQPQRDQHAWIDRGPSGRRAPCADRLVERGQIECANSIPQRPNAVVVANELVEIARLQSQLLAIRSLDAWVASCVAIGATVGECRGEIDAVEVPCRHGVDTHGVAPKVPVSRAGWRPR